MTTATTLGLRDRKRIETRARLEDAALFLVLRDGLDATTVDAIADRADVSPRTFFNYFDSKDGAILGLHQSADDAPLETAHLGDDLVVAVVGLVMDVMGASTESRATAHDDRLEVIRRHPEVLAGQMAQLSARAGRLTAAITELMHAAPDFTPEGDPTPEAEVLLALCGSAVRASVREWATGGSSRPIETIEQRATALVKTTVEKLA